MTNTLQLLDRALATAQNQADLCRSLHVSGATLTNARNRGRLSPTLAGTLAERLGEPVDKWVALAALEATPKSRLTDHLKRVIDSARKS